MPRPERSIAPAHKKRLLMLHSIGPAAGAVALWILFLLKAVFNVDPDSLVGRHPEKPPGATFWLIFALAGTVVAVGFVLWQTKRALDLARRGTEVVAKVGFVSPVPLKGLLQVHCKYSYRNKEYTHRWSEAAAADIPAVGESVTLIVDRHNPEKCMRASELFLD
jgi:hypothetical protein